MVSFRVLKYVYCWERLSQNVNLWFVVGVGQRSDGKGAVNIIFSENIRKLNRNFRMFPYFLSSRSRAFW